MAEALRRLLGEARQLEGVVPHLLGDVEPSEAVLRHFLVLGIRAPQASILRPEPRGDLLRDGGLEPLLRRLLAAPEPLVHLVRLAESLRLRTRADRVQQVLQRCAEQLQALVGQLAADRLQIDADLPEAGELRPRLVHALQHRIGHHLAVLVERLQRGERHGVDRLAPDQRLDVEHVAVRLVLGAGRRPQGPLPGGALRLQRLPARRGDAAQVDLVRLLRVRDGDLAQQRLLALLLDQLVGGGVDAADEE